eukprot:10205225-Alexandrium_andersonii.AAC.1
MPFKTLWAWRRDIEGQGLGVLDDRCKAWSGPRPATFSGACSSATGAACAPCARRSWPTSSRRS